MSTDDDRRGGRRWYPPEMRYVPFPGARATTAKDACERVAGLLNDHLLARPGLVTTARASWEGRHRQDFDDTWTTYEANLTGIKEALLLLAGSLSTAADNAAFLNGQRTTMRRDYDATHPVSSAH